MRQQVGSQRNAPSGSIPAPRAMPLGICFAVAPHLIRFLEVMRGSRMAAPTRLEPVMKMPLHVDAMRSRCTWLAWEAEEPVEDCK